MDCEDEGVATGRFSENDKIDSSEAEDAAIDAIVTKHGDGDSKDDDEEMNSTGFEELIGYT